MTLLYTMLSHEMVKFELANSRKKNQDNHKQKQNGMSCKTYNKVDIIFQKEKTFHGDKYHPI